MPEDKVIEVATSVWFKTLRSLIAIIGELTLCIFCIGVIINVKFPSVCPILSIPNVKFVVRFEDGWPLNKLEGVKSWNFA